MQVGADSVERGKVDLSRDWREELCHTRAENNEPLFVVCQNRVGFVVRIVLWNVLDIVNAIFVLVMRLFILDLQLRDSSSFNGIIFLCLFLCWVVGR
jgi:hypothetical protein